MGRPRVNFDDTVELPADPENLLFGARLFWLYLLHKRVIASSVFKYTLQSVGYHGNKYRPGANFNDAVKLPDPESTLVLRCELELSN